MRLPLALLALLVPALAAPALAHNDLPRGQVMIQGVTVTEVGYSIAPVAGGAVVLLQDDYVAVVSEGGHGAQTSAFALGPSALPQRAAARSDPVWGHSECTPLAAPLQSQWTINMRDAWSTALVLTSTSPVSGQSVPGSYTDMWPVTLAGQPVGVAWVKYRVTFFVVGGSIC